MSMVVFSTSEKGKGLASDHAGLENGNILHRLNFLRNEIRRE